MKINQYFTLLILIFCCLNIKAQTSFGVGLSYNLGYFQHENYKENSYESFEPDFSYSVGLNTYLDLKANNRFQLGLNIGLGKRNIVLSEKINGFNNTTKNVINFDFLFSDISILSFYELYSKRNFSLSPIIGFFFSFNQFNGFEQSSFGSAFRNRNSIAPDLRLTSKSFVFYPGINLGIRCEIQAFRMKWIPFILLYYSPSNSFVDMRFTNNSNSELQLIKGKYQNLSIGINVPLSKAEN